MVKAGHRPQAPLLLLSLAISHCRQFYQKVFFWTQRAAQREDVKAWEAVTFAVAGSSRFCSGRLATAEALQVAFPFPG